jgi:hypothetical protein
VSVAATIAALAASHSLDRRLASGESPARDRALAARASRLTSEKSRRRLASSLMRVIRQARHPRPHSPEAPVDRRAVTRARHQIVALATRLRDPSPVAARGVAILTDLLRDGSGPLYASGWEDPEHPADELLHRLSYVSNALEAVL